MALSNDEWYGKIYIFAQSATKHPIHSRMKAHRLSKSNIISNIEPSRVGKPKWQDIPLSIYDIVESL